MSGSITRARARQIGVLSAANALAAYTQNRHAINNWIGSTARAVYNQYTNRTGTRRNRDGTPRQTTSLRGTRAYGTSSYVIPSRGGSVRYNVKGRYRRRLRMKYGKGKRRRKYRRRGVTYKKMLRNIWKEIHVPQVLKKTEAHQVASKGCGLRTWLCLYYNTLPDITNMMLRSPGGNFFYAGSQTSGTATTQKPYGETKRLHVTKGYQQFIVQNRDNWDMELKVYECVLRRDDILGSYSAFADTWFGSTTTYGGDQPSTNQGPNQPGYAGGNDLLTKVYDNPTYTPFMSNGFCSEFKVIKTHSFNLGPNQYSRLKIRMKPLRMDVEHYRRLLAIGNTGIGGWTKILLFNWVGGPVDTGAVADGKQSKGKPTLALQWDTEYRWYFERCPGLLYTICSSNATANERGTTYGANYDTVSTDTMYVPATCTVQTVAGTAAAAGHHPDDTVVEDNP